MYDKFAWDKLAQWMDGLLVIIGLSVLVLVSIWYCSWRKRRKAR